MLDVTLLGTGGMYPLPGRYLTALLLGYGSHSFLIDCGEGTQMAARAAGAGFKRIRAIFLTHFHADHVAGLPGLLLTIGNAGRTETLSIIGPPGVGYVVEHLRIIAQGLPFPLEYREVGKGEEPVFHLEGLSFRALPVPHGMPCFAYRADLARAGKFDAAKAKALGVPVSGWKTLQLGSPVEWEGGSAVPGDVLGPPRKGLSMCYSTDMRPTEALAEFAREADLFVCEGHYGDPAKQEKAEEHGHCLFTEAAQMARDAAVRELWLTHFSPSLTDPQEWLHLARDLFPATHVDRQSTTLTFKD